MDGETPQWLRIQKVTAVSGSGLERVEISNESRNLLKIRLTMLRYACDELKVEASVSRAGPGIRLQNGS